MVFMKVNGNLQQITTAKLSAICYINVTKKTKMHAHHS